METSSVSEMVVPVYQSMVFIIICPTVRTSDLAHLSLLLPMSSCREIFVEY